MLEYQYFFSSLLGVLKNGTEFDFLEPAGAMYQDGNMAGWEVLWRRSCWRGGINEIVKLKKKMHHVNLKKKKKVAKKGNSYLFSSVHCRD